MKNYKEVKEFYGELDEWTQEELRTENVDYEVKEEFDGGIVIYMLDSGNYGVILN